MFEWIRRVPVKKRNKILMFRNVSNIIQDESVFTQGGSRSC